jgi:polyisoprenyl-phosphate glycosyltransferase
MIYKNMFISIVVPVYNEEHNIKSFLNKITSVLADISNDYEIIFALDPSTDNTEEIIISERAVDLRIKLLKFSRRFGQPMATLAGMNYSSGEVVIVIDVDLQDPPELIPEMLVKWKDGYDVVIPQRRTRSGEPWIKKTVSGIGYKIIKNIASVDIPPNTGDFRLLSNRVVKHIISLKESHGFLRGMVALVGFNQCLIQFDRPARYAGDTKYNRFLGSLKIGGNGIFGFSSYALTLSTKSGFLIAGFSFIMAIVYFVRKLSGTYYPTGNPTLVILILFIGGVQLISIGILGEYIGRIYEEVRERPKFIVSRSIGFDIK